MLNALKKQYERFLSDDGRNDIDFAPRQKRLFTSSQTLSEAVDKFAKALDDLRDELLISSDRGKLN